MPARLKLYVDWFNKRLINGPRNGGTYTLPRFYQGDIIPMQVTLYEPDGTGLSSGYNLVPNDDMALSLGVGDTPVGNVAESLIVSQFSWDKNTVEKYFYADVAFNTAELTAYLGALSTKTAQFELQITEATSVTTIFRATINIDAEVIEAAAVSVLPGQTPASLEIIDQIYARKIMGPGETLTFTSPDGGSQRVLGVRDDKSGMDDVL